MKKLKNTSSAQLCRASCLVDSPEFAAEPVHECHPHEDGQDGRGEGQDGDVQLAEGAERERERQGQPEF